MTKILKAVNVMKFATMAKLDMAVEIDVAERGTESKADAGELEVFCVRRQNWRLKRKKETERSTFFILLAADLETKDYKRKNIMCRWWRQVKRR